MFARIHRPRSHRRLARHVSWRRNLCYVGVLLALWVGVNVGVVDSADVFESGAVAGRRAYWVAAYWAPLSYLTLIGIYLWLTRSRRS